MLCKIMTTFIIVQYTLRMMMTSSKLSGCMVTYYTKYSFPLGRRKKWVHTAGNGT
jgi:hypothetical protein